MPDAKAKVLKVLIPPLIMAALAAALETTSLSLCSNAARLSTNAMTQVVHAKAVKNAVHRNFMKHLQEVTNDCNAWIL